MSVNHDGRWYKGAGRYDAPIYSNGVRGNQDDEPDTMNSNNGRRDSGQHHLALDGLRGWAALAVALYHCILYYREDLTTVMIRSPSDLTGPREWTGWLIMNAANGSFAVTLFFILSGLVLAESLGRTAGERIARLCCSFAIRRMLRLMPPLIACLLFAFALGHAMALLGLGHGHQRSFADLWDNMMLTEFGINGATWTIQVEMLAIPLLLAAFVLQRACGPVVSFLAVAAAIHIEPLTTLFGRLVYLNSALLAFSVGMLVAQPWAKQAFASARRSMPWLLLIAFLFSRPILGWGSHSAVVTQILIGGALIGHLTVNPSSLADLLKTRLSQFLGRISYSFYLLNVPFIWLAGAMLPGPGPNDRAIEAGLALFIAVTLLTVPLARLSVRYIEEPSTALGRRWGKAVTDRARTIRKASGAIQHLDGQGGGTTTEPISTLPSYRP